MTASRTTIAARILAGIAITLLVVDAAGKLLQLAPVMKGTVELGYPADSVLLIGAIELACVILYAIPRTAPLGAVLLTGYLGGAIASHVRVGNPLFSHILFPTYVAALLWGSLYLRDARLRILVPTRARA